MKNHENIPPQWLPYTRRFFDLILPKKPSLDMIRIVHGTIFQTREPP